MFHPGLKHPLVFFLAFQIVIVSQGTIGSKCIARRAELARQYDDGPPIGRRRVTKSNRRQRENPGRGLPKALEVENAPTNPIATQ